MFIIVKDVFSAVARKSVYEVEWIARCSLDDAIKKLKELRRVNKQDRFILSACIEDQA